MLRFAMRLDGVTMTSVSRGEIFFPKETNYCKYIVAPFHILYFLP